MSPCQQAINDLIRDSGTIDGLANVSRKINTPRWWAKHCLLRLEETRRVTIIRPGRGRKWKLIASSGVSDE